LWGVKRNNTLECSTRRASATMLEMLCLRSPGVLPRSPASRMCSLISSITTTPPSMSVFICVEEFGAFSVAAIPAFQSSFRATGELASGGGFPARARTGAAAPRPESHISAYWRSRCSRACSGKEGGMADEGDEGDDKADRCGFSCESAAEEGVFSAPRTSTIDGNCHSIRRARCRGRQSRRPLSWAPVS
jgi:hypothetical protein